MTPSKTPTTEAGQRLLADTEPGTLDPLDYILAIEAEAREQVEYKQGYVQGRADALQEPLHVERLARALYATRAQPDGQTLVVYREIAERAVREYAAHDPETP